MPYKDLTKQKEYFKNYYIENRKELLNRAKTLYLENPEQKKEAVGKYFKENRESILIKNREWSKKNKDLHCANGAKRRALKRKSIDNSTDIEKIKMFYSLAEKLTNQFGVKYSVDHILPLLLGGKHHQDNLQVITLEDNLKKGIKYPFEVANRYIPDGFFNPSPDQQSVVA